jgi:hypothetical protein
LKINLIHPIPIFLNPITDNEKISMEKNRQSFIKTILIVIVITLNFLCCKTHDKVKQTKSKLEIVDNQKKSIFMNDSLICNANTYYLAKCDIYQLMDLTSCLIDNMQTSDKVAHNDYIKLLDYPYHHQRDNMQISVIFRPDLRGEVVFKKVLEKGNLFDCYSEPNPLKNNGGFRTASIHEYIFSAYTSMIRSIDEMPVEDYLIKNDPGTTEKYEQHFKVKCDESSYRRRYEIIKKAFTEGKIVLKDYGEE